MALKQLKRSALRNIKARDKDIEAFFLTLERFLDRELLRVYEAIKEGDQSELETAAALNSLFRTLEDRGLHNQVAKLEEIYGNELEYIRDEFLLTGATEITYTDLDLKVVESLINFDATKISNTIRLYTDDFSGILYRAVIAGDLPRFNDLKDTIGDRAVSRMETELNTGLMAFNRTVTASKADEAGLTLFLYVGPSKDKVIREFCEDHVDQVFSLEQIKQMDNEQGLDVLTYGGGYNCRHHWRPVSEDLAKELGWQG